MNPSAPSPMLVDDKGRLANSALRTPRAAAIAFSLLLICSLWLLHVSIPADPLEAGDWLATSTASTALHLVPFAGAPFMWFSSSISRRLAEPVEDVATRQRLTLRATCARA
jgi:hypothetical protein